MSPFPGGSGYLSCALNLYTAPTPMVLQLCGAQAPCQAAQEFLQSLLGSISRHVLSLKHPGSAQFLLGPEGQHLLQELEAQFQCVFGTERLDVDSAQVESEPAPVPALSHASAWCPSTAAPRPGRLWARRTLTFSPDRWTFPRPSRPSPALCGPRRAQAVTRRT